MDTYSQITIGGVLLHGAPPAGGGPFQGLMVSTLSGWRGLSGARGSDDPIPGGHGAFYSAEVLRATRSMAIGGAAVGADAFAASALIEQLEAAVAAAPVEMRVSDSTGVWSRIVEVEAFQTSDRWNRARVQFTIDLTAPDPVRYRDPVTVGPVVLPVQVGGLVLPAAPPWDLGTSVRPVGTVVNDGSVPVLPRVTVTGSADGVTVHGGPRRLEFGPFFGTLVMDARERRAWLNGVDVTRQLLRRDWPSVPAGSSQDFYFDAVDASPETALSVEYRIGAW